MAASKRPGRRGKRPAVARAAKRPKLPSSPAATPGTGPPRPSAPRAYSPAAAKALILVVDDELMVRRVLTRILQGAGHEVLLAESGAVGLELYRERGTEIDLVVLDLSMPSMGGAECFARLKAINAGVRVLICTGNGSHEDTETMLRNGALGVINKPFNRDELTDTVSAALSPA